MSATKKSTFSNMKDYRHNVSRNFIPKSLDGKHNYALCEKNVCIIDHNPCVTNSCIRKCCRRKKSRRILKTTEKLVLVLFFKAITLNISFSVIIETIMDSSSNTSILPKIITTWYAIIRTSLKMKLERTD